jgi:hypothetical protein
MGPAGGWEPVGCQVRAERDLVRIGNERVERVLSIADGVLRTVEFASPASGRRWRVRTRAEARFALDAAAWRHDLVEWRYRHGTREPVAADQDEGVRDGYFRPELDDRDWGAVECFTAVGEGFWERAEPVQPGYGWFRASVPLPADADGQPITLGLGGHDHEDWRFYRVWLNGREVGRRELDGRWREPSPFVVRPGEPAYAGLRFGDGNLLAVQCGRLDKRLPGMLAAEMEHYLFRSRLVDQFVAVGAPSVEVADFRLREWASGGDRDWRWATFWTESQDEAAEATFHYQVRSGDAVVRKRVELRSRADAPRRLLDVDVEDFELDGAATDGGFGQPVFVDDAAFCALEHPAGVNQGVGGAVRLRHFPGVTLTPGQGFTTREALFGAAGNDQGAAAAFRDYLRRHGRRRPEWVRIYDPLGLVDYCNPKDPLFHITEQVALDTVGMLEELAAHGVDFDHYIIDVGWQDHASDLTWFKRDTFPDGPGRLVERLERLGVRFGLWFATTHAPWSCGDYPPVQPCLQPNGASGPRRRRELCVAAEPYRSVLRQALLHHVQQNRVRAVKLDTTRFYCNSAEHGHMPGKYSLEAQADALIETARVITRACPELFLIWYWGTSSPFWLLHGDTVFDKGLRMEAAAVASAPNPGFRSSTSLNLDQAARHAEAIPLTSQDSLGIWIGDVIWANRMGKEDWRDAWLLDLARGNLVSQLWGNLTMLDREDIDFLAEWHAFMRAHWRLYLNPRLILGDPWQAEPYGYAASDGRRAVVTLNNPGFRAAHVPLRLDGGLGLSPSDGPLRVRQRHPRRGAMADAFGYGATFELPLRPFEVAVLEVGGELEPDGWPVWTPPEVVDSQPLPVEARRVGPDEIGVAVAAERLNEADGYGRRALAGEVVLPSVERPSALALIVRLSRDGAHWYHREINDLIALRATVDGRELPHERTPRHRCFNGPGSPWLLFRLPVGPSDGGKPLGFALSALLPDEVDWRAEAWLYREWWRAEPAHG